MNILFIPSFSGGKSHQIPLFVLCQRYFRRHSGCNNAFLLPAAEHENFRKAGINVLPIDYFEDVIDDHCVRAGLISKLMDKEAEAMKIFAPDLVIDDNNLITYYNSLEYGIPRISIHRTGFFRSIDLSLRNPNHVHSLEKYATPEGSKSLIFSDRSGYGPDKATGGIRSISDLVLKSKTKVIPGIPAIEKLPADIPDPGSYFYSGPLNLEDNPSPLLVERLESYFEHNKDRKTVFVTTGLIDKQDISPIIQYLLEKEYAVITTIAPDVDRSSQDSFFYNPFLPLNFVCSKIHLVIHHCGSGLYHYPILNLKPAITIGTQCFDREDVAIRLEELGLSKHVPSPFDDVNYMNVFKKNMDIFERDELCNYNNLGKTKQDILETMLGFDVEKVIGYTLN